MSMRQVLDTVDALLKDDALGLSATVIAFADAHPEISGNPGPLSADFNFVKWALPGQAMRPTTYGGNVMLAPQDLPTGIRDPGTKRRDAKPAIEIGFEAFSASSDDLQSQLVLVATALLQLIDLLPGRGTIVEVTGIRVQWAQYESATSGGFLCTVTFEERSYDD